MNLRMREDIKQARKRLQQVTQMAYGINNQFAYNLAIKAYLRGYYEALKNVEANNE